MRAKPPLCVPIGPFSIAAATVPNCYSVALPETIDFDWLVLNSARSPLPVRQDSPVLSLSGLVAGDRHAVGRGHRWGYVIKR